MRNQTRCNLRATYDSIPEFLLLRLQNSKNNVHPWPGRERPEGGINIALLFLLPRRYWVVNVRARPLYPRERDPLRILQKSGWAPGPMWMAENLAHNGTRSPDLAARSQALYRLSHLGPRLENSRSKTARNRSKMLFVSVK
jgi:hypothetical protein